MLNDKHRGRVAAWRREQRRRAQRRAERNLKIQHGPWDPLFLRAERLEDGNHIEIDSKWKDDLRLTFEAMRRADHFTECSCTMCGNPRRKWKGRRKATLTLQELSMDEQEQQERDECDEHNDIR